MYNPESIMERHKPILDFVLQTDPLISARRRDFVIVNERKENLPKSGNKRKRKES